MLTIVTLSRITQPHAGHVMKTTATRSMTPPREANASNFFFYVLGSFVCCCWSSSSCSARRPNWLRCSFLNNEPQPFDLRLRLSEVGAFSRQRPHHPLQCLYIVREGGEIDVLLLRTPVRRPASAPASSGTERGRYPIAARHLREGRTRLHRLLNNLAFVRFAELPPMALAGRRNDRTRHRQAVSHMTKPMT